MVSACKNPGSSINCISVAVCLPLGVGRGDFSFWVVDDGAFLEVYVMWLAAVTNVLLLQGKWLTHNGLGELEPHYPKILGFASDLKELRKKSSGNGLSTALIPLPFPMQAGTVTESDLRWNCDDSMVFHADMSTAVDDCAVVDDYDDVENYRSQNSICSVKAGIGIIWLL